MAKKALSLLAIFVMFYLAAHLWIRFRGRGGAEDDGPKNRLVACHPNSLRGLTFERAGEKEREELVFVRTDSPQEGLPPATAFARASWRLEGKPPVEADATLLRRIASTICELYDPVFVNREEVKPVDGGPQAHRLSLQFRADRSPDNTSVDFQFGAKGADGQCRALVRLNHAEERAVKIPCRLSELTALPTEKYRNLRVMKAEADNVQRAALRIQGKERVTLERAGADWRVLTNGRDRGEGSEEAGKFVNRLSTLLALDVTQHEFSPEQCRSMDADIEVELSGVAGLAETLRFQKDKSGDLVACSSARTSRFRVHREMRRYLDQPLAKFVTSKSAG